MRGRNESAGIIADARILLRAIGGGRELEVFLRPGLEILVTESDYRQVRLYVGRMAARCDIYEPVLDAIFRLMRFDVVPDGTDGIPWRDEPWPGLRRVTTAQLLRRRVRS